LRQTLFFFFLKVRSTFRLYRIVKEQNIKPNHVKSVLDDLKAKYGTPDKQQIKTSSIRLQDRSHHTTTVTNKAIWKVSESEEFIAEIKARGLYMSCLTTIQNRASLARKYHQKRKALMQKAGILITRKETLRGQNFFYMALHSSSGTT